MSGATPPEMEEFDLSQLLLDQAKGQQQDRSRTGSTGSGSYTYHDGSQPRQVQSRASTSSLNCSQHQNQTPNRQSSGESNDYSLNNAPTIFATSPMPTSDVNYNQDYQYGNAYQNQTQAQSDYSNGQQDQSWINYLQDEQQQQYQQQQPQQQPQQQQQQHYQQSSYSQYDQSTGQESVASTSYNPAWSDQFVQQQNGTGYDQQQQQIDIGNGAWSGMNGMNGMSGDMNAITSDNSFQEDFAQLYALPFTELLQKVLYCITELIFSQNPLSKWFSSSHTTTRRQWIHE